MARRKPTTLSVEKEKTRRIRSILDLVFKFISSLVKYGMSIPISYALVEVARAWAGKTTRADINISASSNMGGIDVNNMLLYCTGAGIIFAVSGIKYGLSQRKLRKDTVERLQNRIKTLEKKFDSSRTTSGLTARGDTNPEDII